MLLEKVSKKHKILRNKFIVNDTIYICVILSLSFTLKSPRGALNYSDVLRQNKSEFPGVNSMHYHFLKLLTYSSEALNLRITDLYEENYKVVLKCVKRNLKGTHSLRGKPNFRALFILVN